MNLRTITRREALAALPGAALAATFGGPAPYGALPSDRQLLWHELELSGFLHFTVNTFTGREWGYGDEDPNIFHPTAFDAEAIVENLHAGGMRAVILTCKHHDGFCLWPTRTTSHSVKASKWREGTGDVVRDVAEAARRRGMRFGVYVSPWDRNAASYGGPAYVEMYRAQLRELLTDYGPIGEVWHDGANGGDGYYGGAREKRQIDKKTYYDWPRTWDLIRSLQPDAAIFSDVGPDIRWVGNERGIANETCWATYDPVSPTGGPASPGDVNAKLSPEGTRHGSRWLPAECDVSIRPGWFWHPEESSRVKTAQQLLDLYYQSVGRGASLLLNVPPDRRGLPDPADAASLEEFGALLRRTFRVDLAAGSKVTASNVRGKSRTFRAENMVEGAGSRYWTTDDDVTTAEAVLEWKRPVTFNVVRLRENIRSGQRVEQFKVDVWQNGDWREVGGGTSIGACRLLRLSGDATSNRVRLRIVQSPAPPAISEFALHLAPA
ncbi:MAG: alpha-L-fucosidase [Acidobacteriota bacterium]